MKRIFYVFMVLFLWLGTGANSLQAQNGLNFDGTNDLVTLPDVNPISSGTGYNKGGVNVLNWTTANETNNKGFQVERLNAAGNVWDILGFKTANNKASSYDFTDNTPLSTSYYRLRHSTTMVKRRIQR